MHTATALSTADFRVELGGIAQPLDALWGGYDADVDRLAVLVGDPLDAIRCANLIVATAMLFYDRLRDDGDEDFFRYPDTFVVGVGTAPGEYRRLDVFPAHKVFRVDGTEALLEALTDRRVTLLALPEEGLRVRGPVVRSTWNTLVATVRRVLTYGTLPDPSLTLAGNPTVEEYVEHAITTSEGVEEEERAAVRTARGRLGGTEAYGVVASVEAAAPLLGVAEVLPAGQGIG